MSELRGLLSCDTRSGVGVGVVLVYIFSYVILDTPQGPAKDACNHFRQLG